MAILLASKLKAEVNNDKVLGNYDGYDDNSSDDEEVRALCGFLVGDKVTTAGGPDADGPWKNMGIGFVKGPTVLNNKEYHQGWLNVYYQDKREMYSIKAKNLKNLTDPERSGKNMLPKPKPPIYKYKKGAPDLRAQGTIAARSLTADGKVITRAIEPTKFTFRDGLEAAGLEVGDLVGSNIGGHKHEVLGTIVKDGANAGEVLVRVGDLGIRSFHASQLSKIEVEGRDKKRAAFRASYVDVDSAKRFTLSLDEAEGKFNEAEVEHKVGGGLRSRQIKDPDPNARFQAGEWVRATESSSNQFTTQRDDVHKEMWANLGIGKVRGPGLDEGTVIVQFDNAAEVWTIKSEDLESVPRKLATDRAFRLTDYDLLKRRGSI